MRKFTGTVLITGTNPFFVGFCRIYIKYPLILYKNILCMPSCIKLSFRVEDIRQNIFESLLALGKPVINIYAYMSSRYH